MERGCYFSADTIILRYYSLVDPLSGEVWAAVLTSVLSFYAALYLFSRMDFYDERDTFTLVRVALGVMINEDMPDRLLHFQQTKRRSVSIKVGE